MRGGNTADRMGSKREEQAKLVPRSKKYGDDACLSLFNLFVDMWMMFFASTKP